MGFGSRDTMMPWEILEKLNGFIKYDCCRCDGFNESCGGYHEVYFEGVVKVRDDAEIFFDNPEAYY